LNIGSKKELFALAFEALTELSFEAWFQKWCGLDQCFTSMFWNRCQISKMKILQHFTLFSWWKS